MKKVFVKAVKSLVLALFVLSVFFVVLGGMETQVSYNDSGKLLYGSVQDNTEYVRLVNVSRTSMRNIDLYNDEITVKEGLENHILGENYSQWSILTDDEVARRERNSKRIQQKVLETRKMVELKISQSDFLRKMTTEEEWLNPISGKYTFSSGWGYRDEIVSINRAAGHHSGVDLAAKEGTPILAMNNGYVVQSEWDDGSPGGNITILHKTGKDYYLTQYLHIWKKDLMVKKGDFATKGQEIARVGNAGRSTGAHLHLTVRIVPEDTIIDDIGGKLSVWKFEDIDPLVFFKDLNLTF